MTEKQTELVRNLQDALRDQHYPGIYAVDNETLEAAEQAILENLESRGLPRIISCGKYGPYFKGVQLVMQL